MSVGVNGIAPGAAIGMPPRRDHPMQPVQGHRRAVRLAPPAASYAMSLVGLVPPPPAGGGFLLITLKLKR